MQVLQRECPDHGFLGEEGGMSGNVDSEFLWAIDPLDGKHCSRWPACPAGSPSSRQHITACRYNQFCL